MAMSSTERECIDSMTLHDMEFQFAIATPLSWPFCDKECGEYFLERFIALGGDPDGPYPCNPD
jgi:hypothetical protein